MALYCWYKTLRKKFGLLRFLIENPAKIIINNWIVLIRSQIGLIFLIIEIYNTGKIRAWQRHAMTEKSRCCPLLLMLLSKHVVHENDNKLPLLKVHFLKESLCSVNWHYSWFFGSLLCSQSWNDSRLYVI